jgi:hypothetical protein
MRLEDYEIYNKSLSAIKELAGVCWCSFRNCAEKHPYITTSIIIVLTVVLFGSSSNNYDSSEHQPEARYENKNKSENSASRWNKKVNKDPFTDKITSYYYSNLATDGTNLNTNYLMLNCNDGKPELTWVFGHSSTSVPEVSINRDVVIRSDDDAPVTLEWIFRPSRSFVYPSNGQNNDRFIGYLENVNPNKLAIKMSGFAEYGIFDVSGLPTVLGDLNRYCPSEK